MTYCGGISETITKELALEDFAKPIERQVGLINCYCYNQFLNIALEVRNLEFTLMDGSTKKFCNDWLTGYTLSNAVVQSTSVLIIVLNFIIVEVLKGKLLFL